MLNHPVFFFNYILSRITLYYILYIFTYLTLYNEKVFIFFILVFWNVPLLHEFLRITNAILRLLQPNLNVCVNITCTNTLKMSDLLEHSTTCSFCIPPLCQCFLYELFDHNRHFVEEC